MDVGEDAEKGESVGGNAKWCTIVEDIIEVSQNVTNRSIQQLHY